MEERRKEGVKRTWNLLAYISISRWCVTGRKGKKGKKGRGGREGRKGREGREAGREGREGRKE